jgi:TRAP-type C4-dicarboxylate transport system permease large subunit
VLSTLYAGLVSAADLPRPGPGKRLHHAVVEAGLATGVVLLVIMASAAIGWLLTFDQHARAAWSSWVQAQPGQRLERDPAHEPDDAGRAACSSTCPLPCCC